MQDLNKPSPIKDQPAPRPELKPDEFYFSEAYASIQGEGSSAGKLSWFLRLVGCPVQCTWCDTKFTWETDYESKVTSWQEQAKLIKESGAYQLVLTGGEPLLYDKNEALLTLLAEMKVQGRRIEVETSGYKEPSAKMKALVDCWNVSPKLENAIVPTQKWLDSVRHFVMPKWENVLPENTTSRTMMPPSIFKFVVTPETMTRDFEQIAELQIKHHIPSERIFIMPEGNHFDRQVQSARAVIDEVIKRGYSFSLRQHVIIWDAKRGV